MATTTAVFRASKDAGEPLDISKELTASDLIRYTVPAGGPFVTGAPQSNTLTAGTEVLLSPLATIAANTLTNPMTVADVLLFKEVSEGELSEGLIVSAEPQAPNTLAAMFDGTGGTTSDGQTYFQHMQASQRNQILWTCRENGLTPAAILLLAHAIEPTLPPFIPIQAIDSATWGVLQPDEELVPGTQYLISILGGATRLLGFQVMAEASTVSGDVGLPTAMHITSASGNQTGNGFTSNGVYRSNNTGPLNGTGFGNWTWRVKATRIGDWIQHHYWNDTANIAYRESFDGGTSWTGWAA